MVHKFFQKSATLLKNDSVAGDFPETFQNVFVPEQIGLNEQVTRLTYKKKQKIKYGNGSNKSEVIVCKVFASNESTI